MLRQVNKSVEEYYDEFENLRKKSKIEENMECTITRFVENMRYDILNPLNLKHYEILKANLKEEKSYKAKCSLTSTWSKGCSNWKTTSKEQTKCGGQANQVKPDYKSKENQQPQFNALDVM